MVETGLVNAIVTGIVTGSIVALGAIGLALVYSIAEVPNFAHGELITIGAYVAFFVNRPGRVPVFTELTTGERAVTVAGLAVVFLLAAGSTLAMVYHLGGRPALEGEWWPIDVAPGGEPAAIGVHALAAAVVGALVVVSLPSIWGGMLLAALVMAALSPVFEQTVFRKFRDRGVDLATMLIVALGLSFVLRHVTLAFYSGEVRDYRVPDFATVLGAEVPLSAAQFFDVYVSAAGATLHVIDTGGTGGQQTTVAVLQYPWLAVAAVAAATLAVAAAGYRWRSGGDGGFTSGQTVGPKLTAAVGGLATFAALALALPAAGSVPDAYAYATRIRLSAIRALTVAIAVGMMAGLHLLLKETKLGVAMRASSDNLDLAKVTGINTDRVMMATWIIAGAYAAVAGVMLGVLFASVTPNMGFRQLLLPMFAGVILGGVGSVYGAMLGSFLVGLSMDLGIFLFDVSGVHRVSMAFAVLLVVLLVKPEGLMGGS